MGCKAHITLHQYILYPDYAVPKCHAFESKNQQRLAKQQQLKQLRADLKSKSSITTVIKYLVSLPTEEAHNVTHPTRGAPRINPTVAQKISELVGEGIIETQEIKRALNHYVNTHCKEHLVKMTTSEGYCSFRVH